MGLLARIVGTEPRPQPESVRTLDLTPTHRRISRPVTYIGSSTGTASRAYTLARAVESGFAGSAHAYRCVQAIATNAASLDLVVEHVGPDGSIDPIPNHPVAVLFNRQPNPLVSARVFKEVLWAQLELIGEALVYLDRGDTGTGAVTAAYPIFDPVEVVVDRRTAGTLTGFRVLTEGGGRVALLPSEVLWLRYPHPREPWGCMAPFQAAQFALDLDGWAKAWQQGELRNGARPEGVVYLGDVDPDTHDEIVADFTARHEGPANAGRHLFLSGQTPGRYDRIGLTAAEVGYAELRTTNADETYMAFGVPKDYLAGGTTYENRQAARTTLWSDTILPKLEIVAGEVDRQLLPDLAETCRFDTSKVEALRENETALSERVTKQVYADVLTIDEARLSLGLDPLANEAGSVTLTVYRGSAAALLPVPTQPSGQGRMEQRRKARPLSRPAILREYDRVEAIGTRAVRRLAAKMERVVLKAAERKQGEALHAAVAAWDKHRWAHAMVREPYADAVRQHAEDIFDVPFWIERTTEDLGDGLVGPAFDAGASTTASSLGLSLDLIDPQVTIAMRARADILGRQVVETTRLALEQALLDPGVEAGESIPDLASRLKSVFADMSTRRAEMIARTETVGGFNSASRTAAVASGVVVAREWLATLDNRTRDTHAALDGYHTKGMDDHYPNGLMHPGDPNGDASETIHCRCVETYILDEEGL